MIVKGQSAGTGTVKGKILDKLTKQPVPGASVTIKSTRGGIVTDSSGNFTLKGNAGIYTLEVTFVGYQDKTITDVQIPAGKTNYIEIEIEESSATLSEVRVKARKQENNSLTPVSSYTFSREEIATNPGSAGDIFRALSIMPGVSANGAEYSAIAVRGQGTADNVYFVDNIPVTNISHLDENVMGGFDDPNGGRYSIFAPRVVNQAEFIGGGFPAQYGRRSASYLGLQIKEGNREDFTVDGQIDLLGLTVNYDGPSYLAKSTSLFVSARYQNFGPLVALVNQKDGGLPILGDYILKSVSQLSPKNKLAVTVIYSPETYTHTLADVQQDTAMNNPLILNFSSKKVIIGTTLQTLTGKRSYWKNVVYFTRTKNDDEYGNVYPTIDQNTGKVTNLNDLPFDNDVQHVVYSEQQAGIRSIFTQKFRDRAQFVAGFDLFALSLNNHRVLSYPDTSYIFGIDYPAQPGPGQYYSLFSPQDFDASYDKSKLNTSAYLDCSILLFKRLTINPGLRYDYSGFSSEQRISPRFSGTLNLGRNNSINFAAGVYYQDPQFSDIAAQPQGNLLKEEQIREYIVGYRRYFTPDLKLTIEGWYKNFSHMVVQPVNGSDLENNDGTG
jgi:CarboxypepD_reg-like domain/TonB-dependent Receptor Plug Domain